MTRTRTHVFVGFANPYLVCEICHQPVPRWHNRDKCGCEDEASFWNEPCGHTAGLIGTCPSWSPVDGCQCTGPNPHRIPVTAF